MTIWFVVYVIVCDVCAYMSETESVYVYVCMCVYVCVSVCLSVY